MSKFTEAETIANIKKKLVEAMVEDSQLIENGGRRDGDVDLSPSLLPDFHATWQFEKAANGLILRTAVEPSGRMMRISYDAQILTNTSNVPVSRVYHEIKDLPNGFFSVYAKGIDFGYSLLKVSNGKLVGWNVRFNQTVEVPGRSFGKTPRSGMMNLEGLWNYPFIIRNRNNDLCLLQKDVSDRWLKKQQKDYDTIDIEGKKYYRWKAILATKLRNLPQSSGRMIVGQTALGPSNGDNVHQSERNN